MFVAYNVIAVLQWRQLAAAYPAENTDTSARASRVTFGVFVYAKPWCRVVAQEGGVLFSPAARFEILFPPMFVPWGDLSGREGRYWFWPAVKLTTRKRPSRTVCVPNPGGEVLRERLLQSQSA